MPNPVSMAAGFPRCNANRIIELRAVPTDLDPNDASLTRAAGRGSGAKRVGSAGRGVSRGPEVAPRFAQGTARGRPSGSLLARPQLPRREPLCVPVGLLVPTPTLTATPTPEVHGCSW
jgi:hypothetical protein